MTEYDRAREAIKDHVLRVALKHHSNETVYDFALTAADAILSLPEICVRADDQSVPDYNYSLLDGHYYKNGKLVSLDVCQDDMLAQGFVRIVKREE